MRLLEVLHPEIDVYVRYKVIDPADVETFVSSHKNVSRDEYVKAVLETVIFNLRSEISEVLRPLEKGDAKRILTNLYNGCVMLNPGLDVDGWLAIAGSTQTSNNDVTTTENFPPPPPPADTETKTKPKRKRAKSRKVTKAKFMGMESHLKDVIIGQDEAIESVVSALKRSITGLADEERPLGVFLFAGASGVGKSHLAKELHSYLYGDDVNLVRVDCGEYQHKHENQKLIGCFPPGSMVTMFDGTTKPIEDIDVGDAVISGAGRVRSVLDTYEYDSPDTMMRINVHNNARDIVCTPEHEVLAIVTDKRNKHTLRSSYENEPQWVKAKYLSPRDIVVYPRVKDAPTVTHSWDLANFTRESDHYDFNDSFIWSWHSDKAVRRHINLNSDFARLAGYYVSEGGNSKSRKTFNFTFNIEEDELVAEVASLVEKVFGINEYKIEDRSERSSIRIHFYSRVVASFLAATFGQNTWEKKIPSELKSAQHLHFDFLETAILGDGSVSVARRVQYDTVSQSLFAQMNSMLKDLGFTTNYQIEESSNPNWTTRYRIYVSGGQIRNLANRLPGVGFNNAFQGNLGIQRNSSINDDYVMYRIKDVTDEPSETSKVHDISVDVDECYVVEGFSVHNSPPGYIGHDEGGYLTNQMKTNTHTVVLLDEVEKAHPDLWNTFLRVFDEGALTDNSGNTVSFKDAIIIMTTNLGNKEAISSMSDAGLGFGASMVADHRHINTPSRSVLERFATKSIQKSFKPEFLNRLDKTVVFNHLNSDDMKQIAQLELDVLQKKLRKRGMILNYGEDIPVKMVDQGVNAVEGARGLARIRREIIEDKVSDALIQYARWPSGSVVNLFWDEEFKVTTKRPAKKKTTQSK